MHPPHMGLLQTLLLVMYFQSGRLFLGMDVIGLFRIRDVFVALEWEIFQREVVTDTPGRVPIPTSSFGSTAADTCILISLLDLVCA